MKCTLVWVLGLLLMAGGCQDESPEDSSLNLLSSTLNGSPFVEQLNNVSIDLEVSFAFSAALDAARFEDALSLSSSTSGENPLTVSYTNAGTKANITATLEYNTEYTLRIPAAQIGQGGEQLAQPWERTFQTAADSLITQMPPCTSGEDCLRTLTLRDGEDSGRFDFYANYPMYEPRAQWENLKYAIIVVHGQNRDADQYYQYLTQALSRNQLSDSTLLVAPWFKDDATAQASGMAWSSSGWREGQPSSQAIALSSFAVVDSLIAQLADRTRFPVLETVIVTGHSSGGLFTHAYAAANQAEGLYDHLSFHYVVANSQYFYYPQDVRYNETTEAFEVPSGCIGYDYWPLGFENHPIYVDASNAAAFNEQFAKRHIIYFLGNDTSNDPTLNTDQCSATLLGSSRYQRGENMYLLMETFFAGAYQHEKVVVNGIGHNGEAMYASDAFDALLPTLIP